MNWEKDRKLGSQNAYRFENPLQRLGIIHVGRPVQSEDSVGTAVRSIIANAKAVENRRSCRQFAVLQQAVDHDVSDEENLLIRHALAS